MAQIPRHLHRFTEFYVSANESITIVDPSKHPEILSLLRKLVKDREVEQVLFALEVETGIWRELRAYVVEKTGPGTKAVTSYVIYWWHD